ncbi:hypothetical protein BC835DRAFT_1279618 [Cytidiella melzeri]|nr:hypothetical protein BC835DRAFT_1279618 [Cytidiella melzeri]
MQTFRLSSAVLRPLARTNAYSARVLSTTTASSSIPWFVDASDALLPSRTSSHSPPLPKQHPVLALSQHHEQLPALPSELSHTTPLARLHSKLSTSPFLESGTLLVTKPLPTDVGPPLPASGPKGRRKRGRSYVGEGMEGEEDVGLWRWILIAEVKEGTEDRGAIDSVVRQVRQSLLKEDPPVLLPPRRREIRDGWAMIDAGDFAVHVVSKTAREKFFPAERRSWSLA